MNIGSSLHHLASLGSAGLLVIVIANHVNAAVEPSAQLISSPVSDEAVPVEAVVKEINASSIANMHLFGKALPGKQQNLANNFDAAVSVDIENIDPEKLPKTKLALTVHGLFTHMDRNLGQAIIADKDGAERAYRVGDLISGKVTLESVMNDYVIIKNNNRLEVLKLPEFRAGNPEQKTAKNHRKFFKKRVAAKSKNNS